MFKRTLETSVTPHIVVAECLGDLTVRATEEPRVVVRVQDGADEATVEQEGDSVTITARDDCSLVCPTGSTLTVHTVRGDLRIKGVQGEVTVGTVHGDVALRSVGSVKVERVYGDLLARRIAGPLEVQDVAGDAQVRDVEGPVALHQVGSDLRADGLQGGLVAEQVGADGRLGPPFSPGATYRLNVGSDLLVRLPADGSLRLSLRPGGRVRSSVPDLVLESANEEAQGVLGAGEALLEAQASGDIYLRPAEPSPQEEEFAFAVDLEGLGMTIEARIAEAMAELEARLEESLGRIDSEAVRRQVERAAEQARRAAERAAER
ncbi:MAG TPA: DUF4097 domain-containing protein, partial [Thermoflexia bacterium]|nr:DUF4097 domain-containing protein [Thermoflexia bacterium]